MRAATQDPRIRNRCHYHLCTKVNLLTLFRPCRSYGAVYRAERRTDDMEVAVKIIPADNPADLLKEVDIMLACTSPYIVRLHDCFYKVSKARRSVCTNCRNGGIITCTMLLHTCRYTPSTSSVWSDKARHSTRYSRFGHYGWNVSRQRQRRRHLHMALLSLAASM